MLKSRVLEPKVDIAEAYVQGSVTRVTPMYCGSEYIYTCVRSQPYSLEPHSEGFEVLLGETVMHPISWLVPWYLLSFSGTDILWLQV